MKTKVYTTLGWMAWQGFRIIGKRKLDDNRVKLGAAASLALVLAAGLVAAKATGDDD